MKALLTKEQSQHLIELGVPKWKASKLQEWEDDVSKWIHRGDPIFTLTDILEILPKEIGDSSIIITHHNDEILKYPCWNAYYEGICNSHLCEELIDALYELLCWVIENGYLKLN